MVYRPDIDGLRALAVLAVLFSHLQLPYFGGGYIGVDIFFVISGYVIYGDCRRRAAAQNFSISEFLSQRARRLLPQLFAMCAAIMVAGSFLLLPTDFVRLAARLFSSATGTSNWLFAAQSGYFMPASEWNPLLHTWTLSVEIQFYLVFAFIILGFARWKPEALPHGLGALFVLSLIYCLWPRGSGAPFYDSFARAWEFLLGALLHQRGGRNLSRPTASILAGTALAAIAIMIALLPRDAFFPDWRALFPTCATAVLIVSVRESCFSTTFESGPMTQVGRMSYALYMWHWPIIVFSSYVWPDMIGFSWRTPPLLTVISVISFVTWRYIEEPFRRRRSSTRMSNNQVLLSSFAGISALCAVAWQADGWPDRFDARTVQLDNYTNDINPRREECHLGRFRADKVQHPCVYGAQVPPEIAFWSDSHGVELIYALSPWLSTHKMAAMQFSFSSCAPSFPLSVRNDCDKFNKAALLRIIGDRSVRTVVLAGATDDAVYRNNIDWMRGFAAAAHALRNAGKNLIIVYPVPSQRLPGPRAMANSYRFSEDYRQVQTPTPDYLNRTGAVFTTYDALGPQKIKRLYPHLILCDVASCAIADAQRPYYFDDNHLSLYGARRLVPALTSAMDSQ